MILLWVYASKHGQCLLVLWWKLMRFALTPFVAGGLPRECQTGKYPPIDGKDSSTKLLSNIHDWVQASAMTQGDKNIDNMLTTRNSHKSAWQIEKGNRPSYVCINVYQLICCQIKRLTGFSQSRRDTRGESRFFRVSNAGRFARVNGYFPRNIPPGIEP